MKMTPEDREIISRIVNLSLIAIDAKVLVSLNFKPGSNIYENGLKLGQEARSSANRPIYLFSKLRTSLRQNNQILVQVSIKEKNKFGHELFNKIIVAKSVDELLNALESELSSLELDKL